MQHTCTLHCIGISVRNNPSEESTPEATQAGSEESGARFAGDGYVLLHSLRAGPEDARCDNAAALLTGLNIKVDDMLDEMEQLELREALREELRDAMRTQEEFRGLSDDDRLDIEEMALQKAMRTVEETYSLREIMFRWADWKAKEAGLKIEPEELSPTGRPDDIEALVAARIRMRKEGCQAQDHVTGQREYLCRQAAMKFDAETSARLGAVLDGVTAQVAFNGVLAALIECDTPSELLARATVARRRTDGRNAPADC